jgi:hypothetical protein
MEPVYGAHEAGVAFLAESTEGWPPAAALLGDVHQLPQVSLRRVPERSVRLGSQCMGTSELTDTCYP